MWWLLVVSEEEGGGVPFIIYDVRKNIIFLLKYVCKNNDAHSSWRFEWISSL